MESVYQHVQSRLEAVKTDDDGFRLAAQQRLDMHFSTTVLNDQTLDQVVNAFRNDASARLKEINSLLARKQDIKTKIQALRADMLQDATDFDGSGELDAAMRKEIEGVRRRLMGDVNKLAQDERKKRHDLRGLQEALLKMADMD